MYTEKVFPRIKHLPQAVIEAAALLALGDRLPRPWKYLACGAFNKAYTDGEYILKVGRNSNCSESVEVFAREWYKVYGQDKELLRAVRNILTPTEWLFDCVAVQIALPNVAQDLVEDDYKLQAELEYEMENLSESTGMTDLHMGNWGFSHDGELSIFDPMPWGGADIAPKAIKGTVKEVIRMLK